MSMLIGAVQLIICTLLVTPDDAIDCQDHYSGIGYGPIGFTVRAR